MITAMKPPIYSNQTQMVMTIFGLPINNSIQVFTVSIKDNNYQIWVIAGICFTTPKSASNLYLRK